MEELLLNTKDVCRLLKKNRKKIQQYRDAGLLRMFMMGKGYVTTPKELQRFLDLCVEYQLDIRNKERIILAGEQIKSGRSSTPYRK